MHQFRTPLGFYRAGGEVGGGQAEAGEADMVVRPVTAVVITVRRAFTFVQLRADQHVNDQTVFHVHAPDLARWQGGMTAQLADDMDRVTTIEHLRVAGNQHAYIVQVAHGSRQCGRHIAQTSGFHQISQL